MFKTRQNLSTQKFIQTSGDTLNLSGITTIYGGLRLASGIPITNPNQFVTKGYADSGATNNIIINNGLIKKGNTVGLGGTLTGDTSIAITGNIFDVYGTGTINLNGSTQLNLFGGDTKLEGTTTLELNVNDQNFVDMDQTSTAFSGADLLSLSSNTNLEMVVGLKSIKIDNTGIQLSLSSDSTGDTYYRNGAGYLVRVPKGTNNQVYTSINGVPTWQTPVTGSSSISVGNGLSKVGGKTVILGGALTGDTTVDITGFDFNLGETFQINSSGDTSIVGGIINAAGSSVSLHGLNGVPNQFYALEAHSSGIRAYPSDISLNFRGIEYNANYSANFTNRSLVDKGWVLNQITGNTETIIERVTGTTYSFVLLDNNKLKIFTSIYGCVATLPSNVLTTGWTTTIYRNEGAGTVVLTASTVIQGRNTSLQTEKTAASIFHTGGNNFITVGGYDVTGNTGVLTHGEFNSYTATTAPNTYLKKAIYNIFTGTTAPATYASKSFFNTYTGTTVPATYVLKTTLSTYTGTTAPNKFPSKTIFNAYTGTTAPATFANKTIFNGFTGTTAPATYLSKTAFNTFSGTTVPTNYVLKTTLATYTGTTAPTKFASKTIFNTYTGTTAPGQFANKTIFNGYTANTNTTIGTFISGATNGLNKIGKKVFLGGTVTGNTIVNVSSTKLLTFSGGTKVTALSGGTIAITTTPGTGGSDDVLTWNSTTKKINKVTQASLGGGGGGGTVTGATNGLTLSGKNIILGGTVQDSTIIDLATNPLQILNGGIFLDSVDDTLNLYTSGVGDIVLSSGRNLPINSVETIVMHSSGVTIQGDNNVILQAVNNTATFDADGFALDIQDGVDYGGYTKTFQSSFAVGGSAISQIQTDTIASSEFTSGFELMPTGSSFNAFFTNKRSDAKTYLKVYSGTTNAPTLIIGSTGSDFKGAQYVADYSAHYTNRSIVDKGYVGTAIANAIFTGTSGITKSTFNAYTGTTAPAKFASKTIFNGYTGATLTTLNGKVSSTFFNTYTGTTAPATFANKTLFNGYTGATATRLTNLEDEVTRVNVAPSGTIAINLNSRKERRFVVTGNTPTTTFSFTNTTNVQVFNVDLDCSGTINITMPSTVRMQTYEVTNSRWVSATHILTLSAGKYTLSFSYDGIVYRCNASDLYV